MVHKQFPFSPPPNDILGRKKSFVLESVLFSVSETRKSANSKMYTCSHQYQNEIRTACYVKPTSIIIVIVIIFISGSAVPVRTFAASHKREVS
jgi:hypothetical protein